jgi:hypothetical protein
MSWVYDFGLGGQFPDSSTKLLLYPNNPVLGWIVGIRCFRAWYYRMTSGAAEDAARITLLLTGVVPASIRGGSYRPVFCVFAYIDGRPAMGFESGAKQRFAIEIADDAASVVADPSVSGFTQCAFFGTPRRRVRRFPRRTAR